MESVLGVDERGAVGKVEGGKDVGTGVGTDFARFGSGVIPLVVVDERLPGTTATGGVSDFF